MRNSNGRLRWLNSSMAITPSSIAEMARRLKNIGGDSKYSKTVVCPDGCVLFRMTAKKLEDKNFFKGNFFDYPDMTEDAVHKNDCTDTK